MLCGANYRFAHITSQEGLPHQQVEVLMQDDKGRIWIGTRNGLSIYDGYSITSYFHHADDPHSLNHNFVKAIFQDSKRRIWIGTYGGVCLYRPESNDFKHYNLSNNVFSIIESGAGHIVCGGSQLYLLDEGKTRVVDTIHTYRMTNLVNRKAEAIPEYEELYLPSMSSESYWGTPLVSEKFYNLWDRENDARWIHFYSTRTPLLSASGIAKTNVLEDGTVVYPSIDYETQQWLKPWHGYSYSRFYCNGSGSILGMTTAEMYLIKAECEARAGNTGAAAEDLKTLRRTRFYAQTAAENVTGSVQEVLDERFREMGSLWRFYDIKRLNGAENAGIAIRREILTDPTNINTVTTLEIAPDDPRWALPFFRYEAERMGWEQNAGWE